MEPTIPRANSDILETVQRKRRRKVIICLFWASVVSLLELTFMYEYFASRLNAVNSCIIWLILMLIPFFILGIPKMLTEKSWCGEIIEIEHKTGKTVNPGRMRAHVHDAHCTTHMMVKNGDEISVHTIPKKRLQFKVGDIVCHLKGTNHIIYAVPTVDGTQICPICGVRIAPEKNSCPVCNHSVIKSRLV